jgi:multiple RNA-binding domain-containing protein 1
MSSRLCVKNLPKHATSDSVKEFFSSQGGQVTDSKVLVDSKTGISRRTAFVGFQNEDESSAALKYFHNTYMGTAKVLVSVAKPVGSEELLRFSKKVRS